MKRYDACVPLKKNRKKVDRYTRIKRQLRKMRNCQRNRNLQAYLAEKRVLWMMMKEKRSAEAREI